MNRDVCEHFNPVDLPCAKCEEKRKSEALFLADELEIPLGTVIQSEVCRRAAKELRRLHAELERCKQVCAATSEAWREEAALAEPVQEPVAWIEHEWAGTGLRKLHFEKRDPTVRDEVVNPVWTPLYTAPPQRKPLTDEEIWRTYKNLWMFHPAEEPRLASDVLKFARAIERAHGIGGNDVGT